MQGFLSKKQTETQGRFIFCLYNKKINTDQLPTTRKATK